MRYYLCLSLLLSVTLLPAQYEPSLNARLLSRVDERNVGPRSYNDVWGYEDANGREYAIMGARDGTIIYDLANPEAPEEIAWVPGFRSIWRDIKSFGHFLYVVADRGRDGLLMIDMSQAPDTVTWEFWKPTLTAGIDTRVLEKCHNLYIDEQGICYIAGCNLNSGGVLMFDVASTPGAPQYLGPATFRYSHDIFARGDTLYSADLTNGFFSITDVSDKQQPELLAFQSTTRNFTHNVWLSDDGRYLFTTDERPNANVDAYDISDLGNIQLLDTYHPLSTEGQGVLPHNVHYYQGYLVISYYADGVKVVDASRPGNLIEVAAFDTSPYTGSGDGCWGAFPYLSSGHLLASDMDQGLFVLDIDYQRACYLEGRVVDAQTGLPLPDIDVIIPTAQANYDRTRPDGTFRTGLAAGGQFAIEFSKPGYVSQTVNVDLHNGRVTELEVALQPINKVTVEGVVRAADTGELLPAEVLLTGAAGTFSFAGTTSEPTMALDIPVGTYDIYLGLWGYQPRALLGVDLSNSMSFEWLLSPGYADDFSLDQGWMQQGLDGANPVGYWTRELPVGTSYNGQFSNPPADAQSDSTDPSGMCYLTGNGDESPGAMDVDNGIVRLQSPAMDLRTYQEPEIHFYYWFYNDGGASTPDDTLRFYLFTPTDTVLLTSINNSSGGWQEVVFRVADYISPSEEMYFSVDASDLGEPHLVEAAIDGFRVREGLSVATTSISIAQPVLQAIPNPFREQTSIQVLLPQKNQWARLRLLNQWGQQLKQFYLSSEQEVVFLGSELPAGVYFLVLERPQKAPLTTRLIRQ